MAEALDRSYGKPKQASEISGPGGEPIRTSTEHKLDTKIVTDPRVSWLNHQLLGLYSGQGWSPALEELWTRIECGEVPQYATAGSSNGDSSH